MCMNKVYVNVYEKYVCKKKFMKKKMYEKSVKKNVYEISVKKKVQVLLWTWGRKSSYIQHVNRLVNTSETILFYIHAYCICLFNV